MTSKSRVQRTKALRAKPPQIKRSRTKIARHQATAAKTSRSDTSHSNTSHSKSSRHKVRAHRKRMRAKGFRLVQMWLPGTRTAALAVANSPTEKADQAFIDSISWWNSEEAATLSKSEGSKRWWRTKEHSSARSVFHYRYLFS